MRKELSLREWWRFHKGDIEVPRPTDKGPVYSQSKTVCKLIGPAAYNYFSQPDCYGSDREMRSEGWQFVHLPHDYILDQPFDRVENNALGYVKYDNAWYRRVFKLENTDPDSRVTLFFEGIAGKATVYLNGCYMGYWRSSYAGFEIDISNYVYYDKENILAVYVDTTEFEGWWYQGGGIYRDVKLRITPQVCIDRYGIYAPAKKQADGSFLVDTQITLRNDSDDTALVTAEVTLLDAEDETVAAASAAATLPARETATVSAPMTVTDPQLWDIDSPYQYTVKAVLSADGEELDADQVRIGFRTLELTANDGLFLNGRRVVLKGVCCHQDFGLTGLAVPDNIARYKIKMMKEMGANAYRTSHYAQSVATMDALDDMGFLVMDENRWFSTDPATREQLRLQVLRDRNRPSVIFWSTSNEEPLHITPQGGKIQQELMAEIRKLDDTRFITVAQSDKPEQSYVFESCDAVGINYNLNSFDPVHEKYPEKPIYSSENCATGTTRDWCLPVDGDGRLEERDRDVNDWFLGREKTWKFFMERPYILGGFQWAAVEHRGEAAWPTVCSKSGAIDLFLQRKGAFYQNMSLWSDTPMVHILPHWEFWGLEGQPIEVRVYTNCDTLELFLNGESLGKKEIERFGHGAWEVPFTPGELTVNGYKDGVLVATDTRRTPGKPARLQLKLENEVEADGTQIALFTCTCTDENGTPVVTASPYVQFSTDAPAQIVGTGSDNCDHARVSNTARRMYAGRISVAVRPAKGQKALKLFAQADGLATAYIRVDSEE